MASYEGVDERTREVMTTANGTFHHLAMIASRDLNPPGRATAASSTLMQIADISGDLPLTLGDARVAYEWLGQELESDDDTTRARRRTCRELAGLLESEAPSPPVDVAYPRMVAVLQSVIEAFADSGDPRHKAMAATAHREAGELRRCL